MITRPQQTAAAAAPWIELGDGDEYVAPVPRVSLQAFCETAETAAAVQAAAEDRRMMKAHVRIQMGGIAGATEAYRNDPTPNLILLETATRGEDVLNRLDELAQVCDLDTRVIVIRHLDDVILRREILRRGVSEYLVAPVGPLDIVRVVSRLFGAPDARPLGRVIAVVGAKGGVGASAIAHNIAWAAARDLAIETVIADLDLAFGTASLDYNQDPPHGIADAVTSLDRVDATSIDRLLSTCSGRLRLLAAPATIDRVYEVAAESFDPAIDALQASASCVVLDVPHVWTAWSRRILVGADTILIVAAPDLASLRNAKNLIEMLHLARPNDRPPLYCLNQVGVPKRPEIKPSDFASALADEPVAVIPFEPQLFGAAANNGQMIAEVASAHRVADVFRHLAETVAGCAEAKKGRATLATPLMGKLSQR